MNVFGFGCTDAVCEKPFVAPNRGIIVTFWELTANPKRRTMVMSRFLDDHSLVQECRAGQTEAFGALVACYQDRLYPTVLRLVGSAEDAEDVLQDTFVRAFEKLDQFQGDSSFYTWIYRIAVNLSLSGYRRRRARSLHQTGKRRFFFARDDGNVDLAVDADPAFPLERAEREKIVEAALNDLGPDHRAVVV